MTTTQVRVARHSGTCHAPGCPGPIWPGHLILTPGPGRAWRHADCASPGRRTRQPDDPGTPAGRHERNRR